MRFGPPREGVCWACAAPFPWARGGCTTCGALNGQDTLVNAQFTGCCFRPCCRTLSRNGWLIALGSLLLIALVLVAGFGVLLPRYFIPFDRPIGEWSAWAVFHLCFSLLLTANVVLHFAFGMLTARQNYNGEDHAPTVSTLLAERIETTRGANGSAPGAEELGHGGHAHGDGASAATGTAGSGGGLVPAGGPSVRPLDGWYYCAECARLGHPPIAPPRSHHCRTCRRCVLRMDHHCMFFNACIGAANHRHFLLFVLYMLLATVYILVMCLHALHARIGRNDAYLHDHVLAYVAPQTRVALGRLLQPMQLMGAPGLRLRGEVQHGHGHGHGAHAHRQLDGGAGAAPTIPIEQAALLMTLFFPTSFLLLMHHPQYYAEGDGLAGVCAIALVDISLPVLAFTGMLTFVQLRNLARGVTYLETVKHFRPPDNALGFVANARELLGHRLSDVTLWLLVPRMDGAGVRRVRAKKEL